MVKAHPMERNLEQSNVQSCIIQYMDAQCLQNKCKPMNKKGINLSNGADNYKYFSCKSLNSLVDSPSICKSTAYKFYIVTEVKLYHLLLCIP